MASRRGATWIPQPSDYRQILTDQNPWHASKTVPAALAPPVERPLGRQLWRQLRKGTLRRFQLVLGPRRVGKTTAMYQTVRRLLQEGVPPLKLWWLRLDHPLLMEVSLGGLAKSVVRWSEATPEAPAYLFLDELTYAKDWDVWLKTFHDEGWPIRIAGTSSATAVLRRRRHESGVGRWEEQYLAPYLFPEFLELMGRPTRLTVGTSLIETLKTCVVAEPFLADLPDHRRRFMLTGGFPELLVAQQARNDETMLLESQRTLRSDAVERAIYKDIPQAFEVGDRMLLERLLYTLAGQVTGILSPQNLCQALGGMSQPTFDRYLSYLEQAFLVFTLQNYSGSEASKQRRGRKLYFVDGAVRNASLQRGLAPLRDGTETGLLLENMAAAHLHALSQQSQVRLYYWRDGNHEVDLVYDHPESPVAFEIASSGTHADRNLRQFQKRFPKFQGRCFMVAPGLPNVIPASGRELGTLALDLLLLAVGAQVEDELAKRLSPRELL